MEELNKITPPLPSGYEPIKKQNSSTPPLPSGYEPILKKKEPSQPTSQKDLWGSNSQPKDVYTSLVTDQQIPQQESDTSDGITEKIKAGLKTRPGVESFKKKPITPKKEVAETIKDTIPETPKATSIEKGKEDFSEATQKARKESKSLVDKKQIDQKISEVSTLQNEYVKSLKEIDIAKKLLSDEKSEIDYQMSIGNNTPEFQERVAIHNAKVQENLDKFNLLKDKSEVINYNKKVIESASGNLLRDKAEKGNWFGAIYNTMLEKASSMASAAASKTIDFVSEIIPSEYLISPKELKSLKDKGLNQNQIDDYIKKSAKKDVLPAIRKGNVELFGDKGTTEEYIKKKEDSGVIEGGILGLAGSVPAMMGGVYGRAANFFLMGSDAVEQEMESNPDFQNVSENEKLAVIVPIGIANAVLEEFGLQGVMKNNSIVNKLVHKTLLKVGADASAGVFRKAINNEIKGGIASGLFKVGSGFTSEFITGGSQQTAEIGIKDIYNTVKDKKMFQTPETLSDAITQISDAAIMEGIGGTVMSTLPAINTAMQNNDLGKKSTDFEFEILDNINENSEEFKKLFTTDLKNKMIEGKITKDEAESQLKSFDKMTATFNRMPKDMSIEDKKKSFDLLVEKDKLTDEINGKDESLSTKQKERIAEINKELSDISLGVKQEQKIQEVTPVETTEIKTTPEDLAKQYKERITAVKESDPEQYWSVDIPSDEVILDAAKNNRLIDKQGGMGIVTNDGNMIGMFKYDKESKGTAKAVQEERVKLGGIKLDNFDGYLTQLYQKNGFRVVSRVPFNEEYSPDDWNKEKHGTPDVVAMVYDPNNELNIEEKTFEDYDEAMAYRDSFVDQAKINTEVKGLSNLFDESEKSNNLPSLVQKAKTSLSKILPNVDVVLYDTESDYYNAIGEKDNSGGAFMNNIVHINPNRANGRTVAHEVFHAVLLNKVKSDPEAQRVTAAMIKSVEKVLTPDMKAKLQEFVESGYDTQKNLWNEEKLAELVGFLAENYDTLPQSTQNIIKQWLDQLAKLVGIKEFTDKEVIDFMNTLSGKVTSGEVITEKDVKILSGGKKITNPFDYFKRKQVGAFDVQYTEQDRLDKLIKDKLVTKPENLDFLSGKYTAITSPDDMLAGTISIDGKVIFEGGGGVFFVTKYGDAWASGNEPTADRLKKEINNSYNKNGDKGYLVLAKGSDSKLISSASGVNSSLAVLETMIDKGLISPSDFRSAVSESIKRFGGKISLKGSAKQLKEDVNNYFSDPESSTFEVRGSVLGSIINSLAQSKNTKLNKDKIIEFLGGDKNKGLVVNVTKDNKSKNQSLSDLISGVASEQLTKGLSVGDIYAVIEVDGEVDVKKDSHPSYPYHVVPVGKTKVILHLPKDRQNGSEILTTSTGKPYTVGNVSIMSGSFNGPIRKQIVGEKAVKDKVVQDNLSTAKEMEAANKSAEDIFIATGWEKGADNKWKYDLQEGVVEFKNKKNGKASEVVNYPELFKAYPKAKNIDIVFMNSDKFEGMYIPSKNRIMLSNSLSDSEAKSTLLHEVQHFIQHEEGFAVGGTAQTIKDLYNARIKYEKNFSVKKVLNNIKNSLFKPNPESVKEDLDKLSKLVSKSDEDLYRSIAGEVEAFNVEKRAGMTAEERRATPISETADKPKEEQVVISDSDIMLKDRLQKVNGINDMVRVAKEAKYSDAAIKSYLNSKGFTEDQIKSAFESYLSEDEAYSKFNETFEQAKKELKNKKTVKEYFKGKYRNLLKNWSNRQVEVQSLLANTGMVNTLNLNINSQGYSGRAKKTFEESYNKIYRGLNIEKRDILDKVIQAKRFIAIDNNRAERGLDPVKHPNFLNKDTNEKYLNKLKSEIGSKSFEDINSRANEYFKTYKKLLKDVYENGLINKEAYDSMNDIDYQPRVFLKFVTDFDGDIKTNKNNVDSASLGSSQIKAMTEGSASSLVSNSEWLLSNSLVARTNAIAKNNINKRFMTDEFPKAKERFKKLDPKNLKGDDKRFYEYFKELDSKVIENPVVGKNKDESLKFKYDGVKNPENFTKTFYYVDGVQYSFFLEDGLYKSWTDTIDGFIDKGTKEMLSYASGSALVKAIATGNNPAFLIVNTPRDLMFTATFSEEYNDLVPVALAQIGKDVMKSIREISKKDSDIVNKYFEYGGAMDFLSSQGTLKKDSILGEFLSKMIPPNVKDNLKGIFNAVTLKKMSEYSELMFRLGIFQRSIANSLKELGYKDISEIKDKQQVDDIYNSAVASARGILDFNRGGLATKDLESIMPYVNVAFQGGSVALNAFKKRPAATTSRMIQIATMASTIPAGISLMLIAANKDDDDEKTVHEIYLDAMAGISKYQKSKYMNIVTGMKDEDGQYMIIKIAKAQELSPVISVTDNILENSVRKMAGKELKSNSDIAREALFSLKSNVLPIDVTSPSATVVRNPMIKAILTYQTGYDFFREEPLSMKLESKPAPYEGMDMKSVEGFYKKLGSSAGLSPVRSKAFVESLITTPSTNPFIGFLYGGAEAMTSDKEAKEIGSNLVKNLKRSTVKRLVSYTSDFNRNLDTQNKLNDKIEEIKLKDAILNSEIKEISDEFISDKISEKKFVSELKDLNEFDRRRAFNKAKDRKKLKNIDANIIDIKYEKDAEIKALMIKSYYGNILDGSEDSERVRMQMIKAKGVLTPEVLSELKNRKPAN
jgi:hypothetical protein